MQEVRQRNKNMVGHGAMNAGEKAKELGICGITNAVEDVIVARDIIMSKEAGCQLHLCHCSTKDSAVLIKMAKEQSLSLNPSKISGICGRLLCCLKYENDVYVENRKCGCKVKHLDALDNMDEDEEAFDLRKLED